MFSWASVLLLAVFALASCSSSDDDVKKAEAPLMTAFGFYAEDNAGVLSKDYVGTISGTSITVSMPSSINKTALVARFTTNEGNKVLVNGVTQVSQTTKNDFTNPVDYTVSNSDGSNNARYSVTITKSSNVSWSEAAVYSASEVYAGAVLKINPTNNVPMIAFKERADESEKMTVVQLSGSSLANVGNASFSSKVSSSNYDFDISPEGTPYVAYSNSESSLLSGALSVMRYDGSAWTAVGDASVLKAQSNFVGMAALSGNRLVVNLIDQESRKDTRAADASQNITAIKGRNGGLLAYWTGEAAAYTASQMKFIQDTTEMQKLTGLCYATEEMLQDVPAMSAYIAQGFADEFAFKIDDAILNGTGNGMPLGVLATSATPAQNNGALVTIAKESGQPNGTLVLNNILKMWNAMPANHRANAKWYINQDLEILLYQLLMNTGSLTYTGKDSDAADVALSMNMGMPLFVPAGSLANSPHGTLLGRPIVPIEQAGAVGEKGDISLLDLSQYRWIDKSGVNAQTSIHVRFLYDETAFKFTYRAGGKPIWKNTIEAYKGNTVRSPFVTLAARS